MGSDTQYGTQGLSHIQNSRSLSQEARPPLAAHLCQKADSEKQHWLILSFWNVPEVAESPQAQAGLIYLEEGPKQLGLEGMQGAAGECTHQESVEGCYSFLPPWADSHTLGGQRQRQRQAVMLKLCVQN